MDVFAEGSDPLSVSPVPEPRWPDENPVPLATPNSFPVDDRLSFNACSGPGRFGNSQVQSLNRLFPASVPTMAGLGASFRQRCHEQEATRSRPASGRPTKEPGNGRSSSSNFQLDSLRRECNSDARQNRIPLIKLAAIPNRPADSGRLGTTGEGIINQPRVEVAFEPLFGLRKGTGTTPVPETERLRRMAMSQEKRLSGPPGRQLGFQETNQFCQIQRIISLHRDK